VRPHTVLSLPALARHPLHNCGDVYWTVLIQEGAFVKYALIVWVVPSDIRPFRLYVIGLLNGALNVWLTPLLSEIINCPLVGGLIKLMVPDTE